MRAQTYVLPFLVLLTIAHASAQFWCDAGYAAANCQPCMKGTFKPTAGTDLCRNCPAGTFSSTIAASTCETCSEMTYSASTGASSRSSCLPCDQSIGLGTLQRGASSCASCIPGWRSPTGAAPCARCADGQIAQEFGATECTSCDEGLYASEYNNSCVACPDLMVQPPGGSRWDSCVCGQGARYDQQYNRHWYCHQCERGWYQDQIDRPSCLQCPADTYSNAYQATACVACPGDSTNSMHQTRTSVYQCMCRAGYTGPDGGPCVACAAGTYKASTGSAACTACPARTTSPQASTASAACVCTAGRYFLWNTCIGCEPHTYKDVAGNQACSACAANTWPEFINPTGDPYMPRLGSTCVPCPSGSGCPGYQCAHIRECRCDRGHVGQRESVCLPCEAGSFAEGFGWSHCQYCTPGTYQDGTAATACKKCLPGTTSDYTETGGPVTCTGCPSDAVFDPATNACVFVCSVGFTGPKEGPCVACGVGTYKNTTGSAPCVDCGVGANSPAASASADACVCRVGFGV